MSRNTVALAAVVALGAALRLPGLLTDFWLDEIWTLAIALDLDSPLEIFTNIRHSNNHYLNTFVFYALGDQPHWIPYRIHSMIAGIVTVALAWHFGAGRGTRAAIFASVATAVSYLLIHFSSEARGYAMMILFAFVAFLTARAFVERRRWPSAVVLWAAVVLGVLSQLGFVQFLGALAVWVPFALYRRCDRIAEALVRAIQALAVPAVLIAAFYWLEVRHMRIGGGPEYDLLAVLVKTLSYAGGGPATGVVAVIAAIVTVLVMGAAVFRRWRQGLDDWLFFAMVIFVAPAAVLVIARPDVLFVRYFLLSVAFGLVAAGVMLAELWRGATSSRVAAGVLATVFVVGNLVNVAILYRHGRGDYLGALRYIVSETPGGVTTLATDNDFRNRGVISYYQRFLPRDSRVILVGGSSYPREGPGWWLLHRIGEVGEVKETITDRHGNTYVLRETFPYSDLSGMHWLLYRRTLSPP
ncbi:MAG: glycosyltransferase family 39 protein [Acidobacteriota bacterium]|nr:glycosyltransferase family 39 protein [Acidobacteriota bacterium]